MCLLLAIWKQAEEEHVVHAELQGPEDGEDYRQPDRVSSLEILRIDRQILDKRHSKSIQGYEVFHPTLGQDKCRTSRRNREEESEDQTHDELCKVQRHRGIPHESLKSLFIQVLDSEAGSEEECQCPSPSTYNIIYGGDEYQHGLQDGLAIEVLGRRTHEVECVVYRLKSAVYS